MYHKIQNNMAGNIAMLAIYVDYQKAYDTVWYKGFVVKLNKFNIPPTLLKLIMSRLNNRRQYVVFGQNEFEEFHTHIGLPQGDSLCPYLFIVYHCDLVKCLGTPSSHLFADDLSILISPPISQRIRPMIKLLEEEGRKICNRISDYSKKWKQPINISKTALQVFHFQVRSPVVNIYMDDQKMEMVNEFKYLGFT